MCRPAWLRCFCCGSLWGTRSCRDSPPLPGLRLSLPAVSFPTEVCCYTLAFQPLRWCPESLENKLSSIKHLGYFSKVSMLCPRPAVLLSALCLGKRSGWFLYKNGIMVSRKRRLTGQSVWDVCAAGVGILSGAAVGQPYHSPTEMTWKLCSS